MLEVKGLHVHYGKAHALKGVSLSVNSGEIVTLIGNNGAGKTTLLNTISGLVRPSAGEVLFEGESLSRLPPEAIVRRGIVQVPEGRRIFPHLTVQENLRLGAFTRRERNLSDDFDRVYSLFPVLKARARQPGGTLSGGEQQMLALARGLMAEPRLLLLDEPSLGLAPVLVETIFRTIVEIHEQGTPILLVEQNAFLALTTADRAYVVETGNMALEGRAVDLLENDQVRKAYLGG
ncbi:MAG TPA: ABC transporter ATP-binding protein [Firmicutes bacterium]|nr:ABC transporter ATP-binding protein [Bacillota bacterium]